MKKIIFISLVLSILSWDTVVYSEMARKFSGMEGWTIIAVTRVKDGSQGCNVDKEVKLMNGITLKCTTNSNFYYFKPTAVIFTKETNYNGMEFYQIKALIGDELYDMAPVKIK